MNVRYHELAMGMLIVLALSVFVGFYATTETHRAWEESEFANQCGMFADWDRTNGSYGWPGRREQRLACIDAGYDIEVPK